MFDEPNFPSSDARQRAAVYARLIAWDNLYLAYRDASRGKRGCWQAAEFEHDLENELWRLHDDLRDKTYTPGGYHSFYIHEPKRRLISAAPFRDRVVHHARRREIEPLFERGFIPDSYANRAGKGTHRVLDRCQSFARRYRFFLQLDVEQFFPAVDHAVLRRLLTKRIKDADTMWLIDRILGSGAGVLSEAYEMRYFPGDTLFDTARPRGLPIGNLTSQFWANVYMDALDQTVKRELSCPAYVRYVDDLLLFADDTRMLMRWRGQVIKGLERLRLTIHPGALPRATSEGMPFLGFTVYPERRRLKRRKGVHLQRKLRSLLRDYAQGLIALADVSASVHGWVSHARYANTVGLRTRLLERAVPRHP